MVGQVGGQWVKYLLLLYLVTYLMRYIYIYIYIQGSIKWILPKKLVIGSTVYSWNFLRKLMIMGPFIYVNIVSMNFFTNCWAQNFFFTKESMFSLNGLSFQLRIIVANSCLAHFYRFFFIKTCFSIYITHSSENFISLALISLKKTWCQIFIQASDILFYLLPF